MQKKPNGFTLMEMMLVLAVIAMIVGISATFLVGQDAQRKITEAKLAINMLESKLIGFRVMVGRLPTQSEGLEAMVTKPKGLNKPWTSTLDAEQLIDPWQQTYQYRNPAKRSKHGFDLFSKGEDKVEGTDDDIGNW